jgi:hypothetical protein
MTDQPQKEAVTQQPEGGAVANPDGVVLGRRQFVQTVGAAGLIGAVGGAALRGPAATPAAAQVAGRQANTGEFPPPPALLPGGQLDSRFPVSFSEPVSQGFRLLTDYFTALNQRDLDGIAQTLHFPFALNEQIEPVVVESASQLLSNPPPTLDASGGGRIMPGSYDLLEGMNVHLYCPVGAAFSLKFTRFTPDGNKLLVCDGIYSVTNNDGRWGIQMASTIFHELEFLGVEYPDAEAHELRTGANYLAAFGYGNEEILNDPVSQRGSYERALPPGTRTASVDFGYGPRERSRNARENRSMEGWVTEGVASRLRVSTAQPVDPNRRGNTNLPEFVDLAGGAVGEYGYTRTRPERPVVLHATHDKAHALTGYLRYTPDGQLISETRSVGILIYIQGAWGGAGGMGQVTHHDRSNSVA